MDSTSTGTPVISLQDVSMRYSGGGGQATQALSNVSLDIARGEFISLIGPSGCGKTTLLRLVRLACLVAGARVRTGAEPIPAAKPDAYAAYAEAWRRRTAAHVRSDP